ncbi:UDP-N-acetylglucosamine transporter TMEM241 homolog isoform X2 [Rhipicephalus microplus]|uniref:UDP-N-acetylglucosamine transporter TMEM241 homolog isoform X2 n=1 Tax=Rhipicephalus microplus TaxID=6941 RepID=UPI003F6A59C7
MLRQSTTVVIAFYIILFSSTFITNKYVLTVERFAYPAIFQCWQVLVAAVGFVVAASCCKWKWHMQCLILTLQYIWKTVPYYTLSIYAGSRALTILPLSIFLGIHNSLLLFHCGLDLDFGKQSVFFSTNPKDLVAFTSVAVSSIMLVTTVPRGFGSAMWWMLLHICCAGVILSTEKSSAVCIKTDAFNRQLIYTTTSFILLLPASYFLGDFHAVFLYPYLTSPGFCWSFVTSAVLGCLLLMLYPTISSLEVVNLNHVGLAKVIVSAISLLSFGVPTVPQDYLFCASRANVPRAREGEEAEEQTVLDRTLVSSTAACPADPRNHCSICKSSRPALQPRLINDELNEAFQRGYVFDQQATNDWACCTVVDRQCACAR